jgi:hypothetical protein
MNELKFNSQVCTTIEQSQRLLALGLKPETADMCYIYKPKHLADTTPEEDWVLKVSPPVGTDIPAWSLHRLLLLCDVTTKFDDLINVIETLIKNGYFNKEYLKL